MSDAIFKTLNDEKYKNWIKGGLGCVTVHTFLRNFVDYFLIHQYENIARGCSNPSEKYRHIKNEVKRCHLFGLKKWSNSNLQNNNLSAEERFNHVEFGKCFIKPPGYIDKKSISDIDCSGLIHILMCNDGLHDRLENPPEIDGHQKDQKVKEPNVFSQALKVRNEIYHSSNECLSVEDLRGYLQQLIYFLNNIKEGTENCCTAKEIQGAKDELTRLQDLTFDVSSSDENKVLQEVNASEIKNLKIKMNGMLCSMGKLRLDSKKYNNRLCRLEQMRKESAELEMTHRALIYHKQRRELQENLINVYKKFYGKTSICPFFQGDNDVDIEDVYVEPNIEAKQKGVQSKIWPSHLLRKNNKSSRKVFVIGNVGTGKTSLCHYFLQSWCHAVSEGRADEPCSKSDEFENIIKELKKFDFVFFLPLFAVSGGIHSFVEIIKMYYKEFNVDIIDDIFKKDSEKTLILADGLNEWNVPQNKDFLPQHHMYGIPVLGTSTKSTVIITSRPTAFGILNMRKSDSDLKVHLLGVISIDSMIEKYYVKQDDNSIPKDEILKKVKRWTEDHQIGTPMLISCFVWMLAKGLDVEMSCRSATYSSVINTMLEWLGNKPSMVSSSSCTDKPENIELPDMLEKNYKISPEGRHIIFHLSRLAYRMHEQSYAHICEPDAEKDCSHDQLDYVLKSGLLLKERKFFPNKITHLSFIHRSFLEYFVALHLVIENQDQASKSKMLIKHLFENCTNATDILRLNNIIIFICGLSPHNIESIFTHTYQRLSDQSAMASERKEMFQLQELLKNCLLEHRSSSNTESRNIPHYALLVFGEPVEFTDAEIVVRKIDIAKVMNLTIATCRISNIYEDRADLIHFLEVCPSQNSAITSRCFGINGIRADNLGALSISKCTMTHDDYLYLETLIRRAVALESLSLEYNKCETRQHEPHERHNFDLSKNSTIKRLSFIDKENAFVNKIDNQNLEQCILSYKDNLYIDCLIMSKNLKHLDIGSVDGCTYNMQMNNVLQTLEKLQTLHVRNIDCSIACPIASASMKDLHQIKLSNVKVTFESFRKFLDGIICIQQNVKVELLCPFETNEELHEFVGTLSKIETFITQEPDLEIITNNNIILMFLALPGERQRKV